MTPFLAVRELKTYFFISGGIARAVDGIDLTIQKAETLGVVGESGCGKTVLALSIMRLVPNPPGRIVGGQIIFKGRDLLGLNAETIRHIRGIEVSNDETNYKRSDLCADVYVNGVIGDAGGFGICAAQNRSGAIRRWRKRVCAHRYAKITRFATDSD